LEDVNKKINILEWTENFDGYQLNNGKTIYCNLKMICGSTHEPSSKVIFVNILDGD